MATRGERAEAGPVTLAQRLTDFEAAGVLERAVIASRCAAVSVGSLVNARGSSPGQAKAATEETMPAPTHRSVFPHHRRWRLAVDQSACPEADEAATAARARAVRTALVSVSMS